MAKNNEPALILVKPQMGENIGAAARVMLNFGLSELRIVAPRDGWPNEKARDMSSGAVELVDNARIFATTAEAVSDINHLIAATARHRDMAKPILTPDKMAASIRGKKGKSAIMFGPERAGLSNEDVVLAETIVTVPVNPKFHSLNLAQSVAILCYEWFSAGKPKTKEKEQIPAKKKELIGMFEHLEGELEKINFFKVPGKRKRMSENLRNMFQRASMTEQEVRTMRGVIRALSEGK